MLHFFSQLNILCTSVVKSHYTENDNHRSHVTAISVFSNVLDFVEAVRSIYQNIQYFIRSKNVFRILPQIDILCTSTVKRCYAKNDNSPFQCHLFSHVMERNLPPSSSDLNLVNSLL